MPELSESRKKLLLHTAPKTTNPKISFPDHYPNGRIVIQKGIRMLDWENGKWVTYIKDGITWEYTDVTDDDYQILDEVLSSQID